MSHEKGAPLGAKGMHQKHRQPGAGTTQKQERHQEHEVQQEPEIIEESGLEDKKQRREQHQHQPRSLSITGGHM